LHMEKEEWISFSSPHFDSSYSISIQNNIAKEEFEQIMQQINDHNDKKYPKKTIIWGIGIGLTMAGLVLIGLLGTFLSKLIFIASILIVAPMITAYLLIIYLNYAWKKRVGRNTAGDKPKIF